MKRGKVKNLTCAAVFAAVIYIFTAYFHIPNWNGYIHGGDAFLYLAASVLTPGYAAAAGAIGAGMADLLSGYAVWAPGTIAIKSLTVLCFTAKTDRILCRRNYAALLPAFFICTGGYYLYECLITGNFAAPLAGIPGSAVQSCLSAVLYLAIGQSLDRSHMKQKLMHEAAAGRRKMKKDTVKSRNTDISADEKKGE